MSEIVAEQPEAEERWESGEVDEGQVLAKRRNPAELQEAAEEAAESLVTGAKPEVPPADAQRAAAVMAAREARQPSEAGEEEPEAPAGPDAEDAAAEVELPPPAPSEWLQEEPDFEAEARAELEVEPEETLDEEYTYEDDPRLQEERVRRVAAEKKAAHYEQQRLRDARKSWTDEALEHAPLARHILGDKLEKIDASSKRSFLRQAAEAHQAMLGALENVIGPAKEVVAVEVAQAKAEAKAAAAEAYGKPTAGPGAVTASAAEATAKVARARERKGLTGAVRAMIDNGLNP